ncbi:MAG: hypothetical protein DLM71_03300 [Chloroflexi bacterium]|nr:MAG: hypothetical protein DLM71_03300 [Chloroflexota bacterium]
MLIAIGVILLVLGVLSAIWGLLFLLSQAVMSGLSPNNPAFSTPELQGIDMRGMLGAMSAVMVVLAIIALGFAAAHIAAGIGVLRRRGWGRITGMVLAVLGILLDAVVVLSSLASLRQSSALAARSTMIDPTTTVVVVLVVIAVFLAAHVVIVVGLIRSGRHFV